MKRFAWQLFWSMMAAVLSMFLAYGVWRYYGYAPTTYQPSDAERQHLYDDTGRSTFQPIEPPPAKQR